MKMNASKKKKALLLSLATVTTAAAVLVTVFAGTNFKSDSIKVKASLEYQITLNSSNAVSTAGTVTQKTHKGNDIDFTYSGVSGSSGNHVRLNQNGYLVNAEQITSIETFTVTFSKVSSAASLTLKSSYDGQTWGSPWVAESGHEYDLGSNPYYIQMTATGGAVDIQSVHYSYSCAENPAAQPHSVVTEDSWVRVNSTSDITSGDKVIIAAAAAGESSFYSIQNSIVGSYSYYLNANAITLTNSYQNATATSDNCEWTIENGSSSGTYKLYSGGKYLKGYTSTSGTKTYYNIGLADSYSSSQCDWSFTFDNGTMQMTCNNVYVWLKYYSDGSIYEFSGGSSGGGTRYLYKKVAASETEEYNTPVDEVSFTATDSKASTYYDSHVYDTENGLTVTAHFSDGSSQGISKGGTNGYSYVVKNSSNETIDSSAAFGAAGSYKVIVSYKDYAPIEIALTVTEAPEELEYVPATMTLGDYASDCVINDDIDGVKVGTSSNGGNMTITIPSGAIALRFYAVAWTGKAGDLSLSASGFSINPSSISLTAVDGATGNSPFTISGTLSNYLFEFTLTNVTSESTLTLSRTNRFIVWGAEVCLQQIDATGVSLSNIEVGIGSSKTIVPTFTPANANHNKQLTWSKVSGDNTISVDQTGKVTVTSGATTSHSAVIRAELTNVVIDNQHPSATCTVSVVEVQKDAWTLLFYVCGADLESDSSQGGAARDDLQEILSVRNSQPDSVNIVVETGGASKWYMPNVKTTELGRWEIDNSSSCTSTSMKKVSSLDNASMGDPSTLQDFLEWGVENYPAEKYGVFMWNHGGAMDGCCFDEKYSDDGLLPKELSQAVSAARSSQNMTDKFEFIAYDACLMAVQDIALWNANDFKYQISSQETEWSGGYDYEAWLPTLYADPYNVSTPTVLEAIGETFMDYYETNGYYDQTQSVYDLSQMAAYKTAFDNMTDAVTGIVNSSSKWSTFTSYVNQALKYGYSSNATDYNNGYPSDVFDVKGVMNALKGASTYSSIKTHFTNVINALNNVVIYNRYGSNSAVNGSCGMNLFCPISGYNQINDATWSGTYYPANYDSTCTLFTKWQAFCEQYGNWAA